MSNQVQANADQRIIILENVRLSFFYGFRPFRSKDDSGKETVNYCVHALMDPTHPGVAKYKQAQRELAELAWPGQGVTTLTNLAARDRLALHDGSVTKPGNEEYAGKVYVSANSKVRPGIYVTQGGANVPILDESHPQAPYSGSWGNVMVAIYAQGSQKKPSKFGQRINAQFMGVQFLRHDTRFGGGRVAKADEFGVVAADADTAPPAEIPAGAAGLV